jgi:hypothetical protein
MAKLFERVLGAVSPVYGAATGEGMMGKMLNPEKAAEIAREEQMRQEAAAEQMNAERQAQIAAQYGGGMKKGGKVKAKASSASKRADGIAQRGKTRGKMY